MAFDGVGDADTADQERGKADQGEKLGEAVYGALELRRGVAAATNLPAGLRQRCSRIAGQRRGAPWLATSPRPTLRRASGETRLHRAWLHAGSTRTPRRRQAGCGLRAPDRR